MVLLLAMGASPLPAQEKAPVRAQPVDKTPEALQVLQRAIDHSNRGQAPLRTIRVSGTCTDLRAGQAPVAFTLLARGSSRVRWELHPPSGTIVRVVDGDLGWIRLGDARRSLSLSETAGATVELFPLVGLSDWVGSPHERAVDLGREEIREQVFDKVEVSRSLPGRDRLDRIRQAVERSRRMELLLEEDTGRLSRLRYFRHPNDWRIDLPVQVLFSDFKIIQGRELPIMATVWEGDRPLLTYRFEQIELDVPVNPRDFQE